MTACLHPTHLQLRLFLNLNIFLAHTELNLITQPLTNYADGAEQFARADKSSGPPSGRSLRFAAQLSR